MNRPILIASACLTGARCRWDGEEKQYPHLRKLFENCTVIPVCPEISIGLHVPRDPIRLVFDGTQTRLVRPADGRDLTEAMCVFAQNFLFRYPGASGAILKSRSPSCGTVDTDLFASVTDPSPCGLGTGIFASEVVANLGESRVTDEKRLIDRQFLSHFMSAVLFI